MAFRPKNETSTWSWKYALCNIWTQKRSRWNSLNQFRNCHKTKAHNDKQKPVNSSKLQRNNASIRDLEKVAKYDTKSLRFSQIEEDLLQLSIAGHFSYPSFFRQRRIKSLPYFHPFSPSFSVYFLPFPSSSFRRVKWLKSQQCLSNPSLWRIRSKCLNILIIKIIFGGGKHWIKLKVCTTLTSGRKLQATFFQRSCAACEFLRKDPQNGQFLH